MQSLLSGILTPVLLLGAGLYFGVRLRFFWFLHPLRFLRTLREAAGNGGTSPFAALSMALAGTLGVGNIAGVATAITAGGAGAVLWMLLGALGAMSVKYAEVYLAVRFRRARKEEGETHFYGGAMYYIRDGLGARAKTETGIRAAAALGGIFALLCAANALLTGTLVQVRAAVSCVGFSPLLFGVLFAAAALPVARRGMDRASSVMAVLIPALSGLYILLSLGILLPHAAQLPGVLRQIWRQAWDFRAAAGGIAGFGVSRAVRYGITRGIFSNEAGCGTAPTAHASANTRSPRHQGCFGIFEVFADTVVLCTITALVILLYRDGEGLDGIELSLAAYTRLSAGLGGAWFGSLAGVFMRLCILLFAFATVICQNCYGREAVRFLTSSRRAEAVYTALTAAAVIAGALIQPALMWSIADFTVSLMTCLNVVCLLLLVRLVKNE